MRKTLVKGSKAAKDFMAKLRAKKGKPKKVNGLKDTLKRKSVSVKKNVAYSVIDKTLKSAQTKTAKDVLNRAKGIIKNTYLGSVALTKKGKPRKYLDKYQKEYNKMIDDYKYFVVHNNKVVEGNEYKSDAIDAANEYYPKAKVYTKLGLKKLGIPNNLHTNKYTLGSTLLINKGENPRAKPTRVIQVDRTKKGAFKKFKRISGVTKKHTDTKSHNVNIDIVSGVRKTGFISGLIIKTYTLSELKKINPIYFDKGNDKFFGVYKRKLIVSKKLNSQVMIEASKNNFGGEIVRKYTIRNINANGKIETPKTFDTIFGAADYIGKNIIL